LYTYPNLFFFLKNDFFIFSACGSSVFRFMTVDSSY
jgi:hypothetical protein